MKIPCLLFPVWCFLSGAAVQSSAAKELTGQHAAFTGPCPTVPEAIGRMTVPAGYEVRCFASEPAVVNPVAMSWDHRGRLWVVELYEYPSGAAVPNDYSKTSTDPEFRPVIPVNQQSPRDRVVILEDTDQDGVADRRTVFLEGLNLATALVCSHGGVLIGQAPNLFYFRDTNGDDRADEYKTILTGFGLEDRHELLNSFTWGPDGWLYLTHGVFTHSKVRRPDAPQEEGLTLNAGVFRMKLTEVDGAPRATAYEIYADGTSNPWGVDFDARGNAFVEACVIDHFFHMGHGGIYARQGGAPEYPYAYGLLPSIVPENHPRHFRAAYAGITIYQGGMYPAETAGHAFFGNIHDNAIHEERMHPDGATFRAEPVRDFLRANDGWFRPVSIQTGPDGFLWVMDWCDKYPCYQNALANPEGVDREKGRIWRVSYTASQEGKEMAGKSRPSKDMDLRVNLTEQLPQLLQHPNSWMRRQASVLFAAAANRQVSVPSADAGVKTSGVEFAPERAKFVEALRQLAANEAVPAVEVQRLLLACGIHDLGKPADPDQAVRTLAAVMQGDPANTQSAWADGPGSGPATPGRGVRSNPILEGLAADPHPGVRAAVAGAIRSATGLLPTLQVLHRSWIDGKTGAKLAPGELDPHLMIRLVRASREADSYLAFSIWMALEPHLAAHPARHLQWLGEIAAETMPLSLSLTSKSAARLCDTRDPEALDHLMVFLERISGNDGLTAAALGSMVKAQEAGVVLPARAGTAALFRRWSESGSAEVRDRSSRLATLWGDPAAVSKLVQLVQDVQTPLPRRLEWLDTLRKVKSETARDAVLGLLQAGGEDEWVIPVLRASAEAGTGESFADAALKLWPGSSPPRRTALAQMLTTREDWQARLLGAVAAPDPGTGVRIPANEIPTVTRRYFATSAAPALRSLAEKVLGKWSDSNEETKALIAARRKACVEGEPDLAMGKVLFTALCSSCHAFHGGGQTVGPELIGSGRSNLDAILANILDPNQIIGNGYQNILITTRDGRTLAGRILEDTPTQVTLLGAGGSREVVSASDVLRKEDTGISLMPMGFGSLPEDQLRSLVWYLLAPPEEGPLTPEKKQALIQGAEAAAPVQDSEDQKAAVLRIDWESVSLWNPDWKVNAPEFEGSPVKLTEFQDRKNVLQLHPFPDRKTPSALSRRWKVPEEGSPGLAFAVAAREGHDWDLVVRINGQEHRRIAVTGKPEPWTEQTVDLSPWKGQEVLLELENHATGWSWEFSYWSQLRMTP